MRSIGAIKSHSILIAAFTLTLGACQSIHNVKPEIKGLVKVIKMTYKLSNAHLRAGIDNFLLILASYAVSLGNVKLNKLYFQT